MKVEIKVNYTAEWVYWFAKEDEWAFITNYNQVIDWLSKKNGPKLHRIQLYCSTVSTELGEILVSLSSPICGESEETSQKLVQLLSQSNQFLTDLPDLPGLLRVTGFLW